MAEAGAKSRGVSREAMLSGPLTRVLLQLAWPTVTTSALQGVAAALDTVMVGRLGEAPVAAVTAARQVLMVVLVAGGAVAASTGILVSQAIGRGSREEANRVATQALVFFSGLICLVLTPIGWYLTPWLLRSLTEGDARVLAVGVPYMRVVILSLIPTLVSFATMGALRGAGDTTTPLMLTVWVNAINVVANYFLIFGVPALGLPGLGAVGAAWGSAVARTVVMVLGFWLLWRGRLALAFEPWRQWRFDWPLLGRMLKLGTPHAASSVALNLWGLLVIKILYQTSYARAAVAAYGLSMMWRNFGTWVTWGFAEATMAMVGQNVGAGQHARAKQVGYAAARVAAIYLLPLSLVIGIFAPWLLGLVLHESDPIQQARVIGIGAAFLRTQIVALPFLGVGMSLEGALRGTGDTVSPLAINLLSLYVISLPLAWVLAVPGHLGPEGVWLGMAVGVTVRGLLGWARWWRWHRADEVPVTTA